MSTKDRFERVTASRLRTYARQIFEKTGMAAEDAAIAAEAHVWADLHGAAAQGTAKLLQYVPRVRAGVTRADAKVLSIHETAATAALDAQHAWGPVAATHTMRNAIVKARSSGLGMAVVRDTSTACALGYYSLLACAEGLIGITINNSQPLQAAWGGMTKTLGNQAFAIASPAGSGPPVLFDTATTAITLNKIEGLRDRGEPVPPGTVLNAEGQPTTDPTEALAGILLPMGGHRGFGLALMWEIFTGVLAGGIRFGGAVNGLNDLDRPSGVSVCCLAIDPRAIVPDGDFLSRVDRLVEEIHATQSAPGVDRVLVPGERGAQMAADRERDGIPIPAERVARLRALGAEFGAEW